MEQRACPVLRILSGLHAGAEMELASGDWLLGADPQCDLVFADPRVAPEHLTLRVEWTEEADGTDGKDRADAPGAEDGGGFRLVLLPRSGARVTLNGNEVPTDGSPLPLRAPFLFGGVRAVAGLAADIWKDPGKDGGEGGENGGGNAHENAGEGGEAGEGTSTAPLTPDGDARDGAAVSEPEAGLALAPLAPPPSARKKGVHRAALGVLLALLAVLLTGSSLLRLLGAEGPDDTLRRRLDDEGFAYLELLGDGGDVHVRGVVPTPADETRLRALADALAAPPGLDVVVAETLASDMRAGFARAGVPLRVTRSGSNLSVTGYARDKAALDALLHPYRERLERTRAKLEPVFWDDLAPRLREVATARRLNGVVRFTPEGHHVAVRAGRLTPRQQAALDRLEAEVTDLTHGVSPLARTVPGPARAAAPAPRPVPLTVVPVPVPVGPPPPASAGETPGAAREAEAPSPFALCRSMILTTSDGIPAVSLGGMAYAEGEPLPEGYRVSEITPTYVALTREGNHVLVCRTNR